MSAPVADFDDALTRTLLAVIHQTRPTVQSVADATGCAKSTAHGRLDELRMAGLVTWEPRRAGTLRACVGEVPL